MKSSHAQRAGFSKVNVLAFWLKGHRTVWKVPHGWNRPGHWDKNKGASVVSVSIPRRQGLSRAICYMFSGHTEWDNCMERLITLPVIMHPSRWLLVCTWAIIYKKDPLQSCLLVPSYSQRRAALENITPLFIFWEAFIDLSNHCWTTCPKHQVSSTVFLLEAAAAFCVCCPDGVCPFRCPLHSTQNLFYSSLFWCQIFLSLMVVFLKCNKCEVNLYWM